MIKARVMLQETNIKKSGSNKHLGFSYMELEDFLPTINRINNELQLCTQFSILSDTAILTVMDAEAPDEMFNMQFASPVAIAKLQGNASPIQELGAQHTYMRRYLYLMAYEISESDALDAQIGKVDNDKAKTQKVADKPKTSQEPQVISEPQKKRLFAIMKEHNKSNNEVKAYMFEHCHEKLSTSDLTQPEYKLLCEWIEKK